MTLYRDGTVDPIAALGARECKKLPLHFSTIRLGDIWNTKPFSTWIAKNLSGRFYVGERFVYLHGVSTREYVAAFEESGEATLFALILPSLKDPDEDFF